MLLEQVRVFSKGQITIPKGIRDALNLSPGTRLTLEVRGQEIVLSKKPGWRKLEGAARDLMRSFAAFKKQEREREDSRP